MSQHHSAGSSLARLLPQRQPLYATRPHAGLTGFSLRRPLLRLALAGITVVVIVGLLAVVTAAQAGLSKIDSEQPAQLAAATALPTRAFLPGAGIIPAALPISATATTTIAVSPTEAPPTASATAVVAGIAVSATTSLDDAWKAEDWPQVIKLLDSMAAAGTMDAALKEKTFAAHFNYAMQHLRMDHAAAAVAELDAALAIAPGDQRALNQRKPAQLYADALAAIDKGELPAAITVLQSLYDNTPTYASVKSRLYQAYIANAEALEKSGKKADAYLSFAQAAKVDATGSEAKDGLARLKDSAPANPAAGKKIEVDIAKQRMTVWQDDKVVYRFVISTGKDPYLTRKGTFKILDKMPNAYSSSMQWGMPWWMGIYYAGKWENGIHAMARVGPRQSVMPDSALGRPQTHGCIMLSDKNAKTLYDWAEVGAIVWIH